MNTLSKFIASVAALIASLALMWLAYNASATNRGIQIWVHGAMGHYSTGD